MKHIEGNLGNLLIMTAGVVVGLVIFDGTSAWIETKFPNPLTAGYLKLRNLRFAVSGSPKKAPQTGHKGG